MNWKKKAKEIYFIYLVILIDSLIYFNDLIHQYQSQSFVYLLKSLEFNINININIA